MTTPHAMNGRKALMPITTHRPTQTPGRSTACAPIVLSDDDDDDAQPRRIAADRTRPGGATQSDTTATPVGRAPNNGSSWSAPQIAPRVRSHADAFGPAQRRSDSTAPLEARVAQLEARVFASERSRQALTEQRNQAEAEREAAVGQRDRAEAELAALRATHRQVLATLQHADEPVQHGVCRAADTSIEGAPSQLHAKQRARTVDAHSEDPPGRSDRVKGPGHQSQSHRPLCPTMPDTPRTVSLQLVDFSVGSVNVSRLVHVLEGCKPSLCSGLTAGTDSAIVLRLKTPDARALARLDILESCKELIFSGFSRIDVANKSAVARADYFSSAQLAQPDSSLGASVALTLIVVDHRALFDRLQAAGISAMTLDPSRIPETILRACRSITFADDMPEAYLAAVEAARKEQHVRRDILASGAWRITFSATYRHAAVRFMRAVTAKLDSPDILREIVDIKDVD